jgi:hypothetical protein
VPETESLWRWQPHIHIDSAKKAAATETRGSNLDGMSGVLLKEQSFVDARKPLKKSLQSRLCFKNAGTTQSPMAGYSGTPLIQKLGIKSGTKAVVINTPPDYARLIGPLPPGIKFEHRLVCPCDFVHFFTTERKELETFLQRARSHLADTGMIWVSWPKRSAGMKTNVTEDVIRAVALPLGFVDTKVCAVDETWSGLKLMIRRENRKAKPKP